MRRLSPLLLFGLLVFTTTMMSQSNSNPSQYPPAPPHDTSPQSNSGASQAPTADMNGNIVEGCVIQVEKDFYLEPVNGGNRLRLRGTHDFSADVGHGVRAEGTVGAPGTSLGGSTSQQSSADHPSDSKPSSSPAGTSGEGAHTSSGTNSNTQDFLATRVTTISETCPSNAGSSGGSVTNPH